MMVSEQEKREYAESKGWIEHRGIVFIKSPNTGVWFESFDEMVKKGYIEKVSNWKKDTGDGEQFADMFRDLDDAYLWDKGYDEEKEVIDALKKKGVLKESDSLELEKESDNIRGAYIEWSGEITKDKDQEEERIICFSARYNDDKKRWDLDVEEDV